MVADFMRWNTKTTISHGCRFPEILHQNFLSFYPFLLLFFCSFVFLSYCPFVWEFFCLFVFIFFCVFVFSFLSFLSFLSFSSYCTPDPQYLMVADFMRYYTRTTISHRTKGQKVKYTKYRKTVRWWAAGFMRYLPEPWYLMIADYMTYNTGTTISFDCRFHEILH